MSSKSISDCMARTHSEAATWLLPWLSQLRVTATCSKRHTAPHRQDSTACARWPHVANAALESGAGGVFAGVLQADGYAGFERLYETGRQGGCLLGARAT
jgi:hypothetical protein